MSVACTDGTSSSLVRRLEEVYARSATPMTFRSTGQIEQLMEGLDISEPGIVDVGLWPDGAPPETTASLNVLAGLGRVL